MRLILHLICQDNANVNRNFEFYREGNVETQRQDNANVNRDYKELTGKHFCISR